MIYRVRSSLPTFKEIVLYPGLNILIADRAPDSSTGKTRNSAGKSSFVEILHFVLGANLNPLFKSPTLNQYEFSVDFDLPYGTISATRSGYEATRTYVYPHEFHFALTPQQNKRNGRHYFSLKPWRGVLGSAFFGLSPIEDADKGGPTFRGLIGYLIRRVGVGGIDLPHRTHRDQQLPQIQVNLSFLFDLDYRLPMALENVRARERQLRELKSAARSGAFGEVLQSSAKLRPRLAELDSRVRELAERLRSFRVLGAYQEIERRVAELRKSLRDLSQDNLIDRDRLTQLHEALESEPDVDEAKVASLFTELQAVMSERIRHRLDEVSAFHRSVVANRRNTLLREIDEANARITERTRRSDEFDRERALLLQTLEGAGALEDFTALQRQLAQEQQELTLLRDRFETAQMLEGGTTKLEFERKEIEIRIREDMAARASRLEHAALIIRELVRRLYDDRTGNLVIDASPNGPIFRIEIEGDRSEGISQMDLWCFDLLIARLCSERNIGPGFLVHDSHVFDGVDERQVATALQVGYEYSLAFGFQYIVTMNSDIFDRLEITDDIRRSVLNQRLSDHREDGGLFGVIIEDRDDAATDEDEADEEESGADLTLF